MESEIVITGMAGRFPESDNISELSEALYNKINVVSPFSRRWDPDIFDMPHQMGHIKDLSKFDNMFFEVNPQQANKMDSQGRLLMEVSYEAVCDAGYDPGELKGQKIGVYVGSCASETDAFVFSKADNDSTDGYGISGCNRTMFPTRISFSLDLNGPSICIDTACASSGSALHAAYHGILRGDCTAAIVGSANICVRPQSTLLLSKLHMLSDTGACKSFDKDCDGYVRSEAVTAIFLQRADVARRKYASIVNIRTRCDGYKEDGILTTSGKVQTDLIKELYIESKLDPRKVSFVEAHGTGTPNGDPNEVFAISSGYLEGRKEPLLIGSIKSNIGHSEASAGLCSVIKVLLAMETGFLAPNIHYNTPNPNIPELINGQVKVVTEVTPWRDEYAGFAALGFGGVSVHGILRSNMDELQFQERKPSDIPQLVLFNGRTQEAIETAFDYFEENDSPREFFALLHKIVYTPVHKKPFRGYKLLCEGEDISEIKQPATEKRPMWYIFPGMGTQWPGMAKDLMQMEVFAKSIRKSAEVLKPYTLDLVGLVTNGVKDITTDQRLVPTFVSITAVQIALVDVLNELGLQPDGFVGHSFGELGCAYADGSLTADQAILASYFRGKALEESDVLPGTMAAVGLTWPEAIKRCPKGIYPSCHNAKDSVTISGPKEEMKSFIEILTREKIFAKEVDSCGYAFHSEYIVPASEKLQKLLEKVIPNPKARTDRWVTSSFPKDKWSDPKAKIADASYYVRNLISPVYFNDALSQVPKNAVVVEIAPHHLLQAILKRAIGNDAEYIGLMRRNVDNNRHLLTSIGKLYAAGYNPDIEKLYPPVQFPVPRGTPMISPLIKWDHSESFMVPRFEKKVKLDMKTSQMKFEVNVGDADSSDSYLVDHCIDGRRLYPAAGYIVLVWKAFAQMKNTRLENFPVTIENIKIHREILLSETDSTSFIVEIMSEKGGAFEVSEGGETVCTGSVYSPEDAGKPCTTKRLKTDRKTLILNTDDIYKELRLRGYEYGPAFQGVISADLEVNEGILKWTGDWTVFLDTICQFMDLGRMGEGLNVPQRMQSLTIDPVAHSRFAEENIQDYEGILVKHDKLTGECFSGGVHLKNLKYTAVQKQSQTQPSVLQKYEFTPYCDSAVLSQADAEIYEQYSQVCSSVSKKVLDLFGKNKQQIWNVLNGFQDVDDSLINSYLKSDNCSYTLLRCLTNIMRTITTQGQLQDIKNHVSNYLIERGNDILSKTLISEIPLRNIVDVVVENASSSALKITEVTEGGEILSSKISEHAFFPATVDVSYCFAHSNPKLLSNSILPTNSEIISWKSKFEYKNVDVFILNSLYPSETNLKSTLQNATTCLKDEGFIILLQRTQNVPAENFLFTLSEMAIPTFSENHLEQIFCELDLNIICKYSDSLSSMLYLLRKPSTLSFKESVINVTLDKCDTWIDHLRKKMMESHSSLEPERIWLVSEECNQSGIDGLVSCLRQEKGGSNIRCVLTGNDTPEISKFNLNNSFFKNQIKKNLVMNVLRKGTWGSYRYTRCNEDSLKTCTDHAYLNVLRPGDLSSLVWVHSSLMSDVPTDDVICQVNYAGVNLRDVTIARGQNPTDSFTNYMNPNDSVLGTEFSGRTMKGKRVMGLVSHKAMATTVVADPDFLWEVPESWTLEEAATVPVAYATAYYALISQGKLRNGDRVLIHCGSGAISQAAIAIAHSLGCEIYVTVGSEDEKDILKKKFSKMSDIRYYSCTDTTFEQYVLKATYGKGVDVVLNFLEDEKLVASLNCLASHGRFLECGNSDMSNDAALVMCMLRKGISLHGILLDSLFESNNATLQLKKEVGDMMRRGIANGIVKPLNTKVFNYDQADKAFKYMAEDHHKDKVVLKIAEEEVRRQAIPSPVRITAMKRTTFDPRKSYIITGGLGGIDLQLCQWLVDHGARNIVLSARSEITTGYQQRCLLSWKQQSVNVVVTKLNASKLGEARLLLELAAKNFAVGGIFNLSMADTSDFTEKQAMHNYIEVREYKIQSTKNMDLLSRDLCPDLDWFICFSSVSSGGGNAGQIICGYSNAVMERICEDRCNEGLPGLAIQWGSNGDVDAQKIDTVVDPSTLHKRNLPLLHLDKLMQQGHPVVSITIQDSLDKTVSEESTKNDSKTSNIVIETIGTLFGIADFSAFNPETKLQELGLDSIIGLELKDFFENKFGLILTFADMRKLTINDLENFERNVLTQYKRETSETSDSENTPGYFYFFNSEDLVPTATIVHMNSVEVGTPLFIIHPIEGATVKLQTIANLLPCPVYGVQWSQEIESNSIENLASLYWKHIKSANIPESSVCLSGYSFGATVAFEMAAQAERNPNEYPNVDSVILLDSSPTLISEGFPSFQQTFSSEAETEISLLMLFAFMFAENIIVKKTDLLELKSSAERIAHTAEKISSVCTNFSIEAVKTAFNLFHMKYLMSSVYTAKSRLKKGVTLIKASERLIIESNLSKTYGLEKICEGKITVHVAKGDHLTFIQGSGAKEVANFISETMSSQRNSMKSG